MFSILVAVPGVKEAVLLAGGAGSFASWSAEDEELLVPRLFMPDLLWSSTWSGQGMFNIER